VSDATARPLPITVSTGVMGGGDPWIDEYVVIGESGDIKITQHSEYPGSMRDIGEVVG
jgi:hypothetical protein